MAILGLPILCPCTLLVMAKQEGPSPGEDLQTFLTHVTVESGLTREAESQRPWPRSLSVINFINKPVKPSDKGLLFRQGLL